MINKNDNIVMNSRTLPDAPTPYMILTNNNSSIAVATKADTYRKLR